jgi:hypothetical protein
VAIQARDAETGKPISDAAVRIFYPLADPSFAPSRAEGTTGADGVVHLRAAPYGELGIKIAVDANGYFAEDIAMGVAAVEAIEPAHLFETVENRPVTSVVALYAKPAPEVELILPSCYRGLVKVQVHAEPGVPFLPGQRRFEYAVPMSGVVQVHGPALLAHAFVPGFTLKFSDGTPLNPGAKGSFVGYWYLRCEGEVYCFFVGTEKEYAFQNPDRRNESETTKDNSRSGRGQGGRGRGRRGGNQSSTSSDWAP